MVGGLCRIVRRVTCSRASEVLYLRHRLSQSDCRETLPRFYYKHRKTFDTLNVGLEWECSEIHCSRLLFIFNSYKRIAIQVIYNLLNGNSFSISVDFFVINIIKTRLGSRLQISIDSKYYNTALINFLNFFNNLEFKTRK